MIWEFLEEHVTIPTVLRFELQRARGGGAGRNAERCTATKLLQWM